MLNYQSKPCLQEVMPQSDNAKGRTEMMAMLEVIIFLGLTF